MSSVIEQCAKTAMRVGGVPILFSSSCVSGFPRISHHFRFLRKSSPPKTKSVLSCTTFLPNTASPDNCAICHPHTSAFYKSWQINIQREYSKYYHTTCAYLGHNQGTTPTEHVGDDEQKQRNIDSLIETWFYEVCPHGSLEADLPFRTKIRSLHPEEYPDMNKVIIQVHYDGVEVAELPSAHQLSQISDLYDLKVGFDEDKANMRISCDVIKGVVIPVSCTLLVPLNFGKRHPMG